MWMSRVLLALVIAGAAALDVQAAGKKKKAPPKAPAPAAAPAPVKSPADLAHEQLAGAWAGKLDGAWTLDLRPATPEQGAPRKDTLTFASRRMESAMLTQEGAGGSNFTLTPESEQVAVWETMQLTPDGDRILWRGEVRDSSMSGTLIRRAADGPALTWSFRGTKPAAEVPPPQTSEPEAGTAPEGEKTTP